MKTYQKLVAGLLSGLLIASTAGCAPVSLNKEWCYQYKDSVLSEKLDIGVYIYSMYQAYNSAKTKAESVKGYSEKESFMDLKIENDDKKKVTARDFINSEAKEITANLIAIDYLEKKTGATYDEATMSDAEDQAKDTWDLGPYASYGSYSPMSKELEPYGVSYDSFEKSSYVANVKQSAIFSKLYGKGGEKEVSDADLTSYFLKNYNDYSYMPVNMYTSKSDSSGNSTSTAFNKKKIKSTVAKLQKLADDINDGKTTFAKALKTKDVTVDSSNAKTDTVELASSTESSNADIAKALKKMDNGKAKVVQVGTDGDSPIAYLVVKNDINDDVKEYINKDSNRSTVLQNMKQDDFTDYLKEVANKLLKSKSMTVNESAINSCDPNMFFVAPEETTAATTAASN